MIKAEIERYASRDSGLSRWDARWKIVSFLVLIMVTAVMRHWFSSLLLLFFSYGLFLSGSLPIRLIVKRLGEVHLLLLPCFVILPFTVPGEMMDVGAFSISQRGLEVALLYYLRAVAIVTASLSLIYSTPIPQLLRALEQLRVPRILIQITLLAYRYIFTLKWEVNRVRWALTTRGFSNRARLRSYQVWANAIGLLLVRSLERTDRVYRAMLCRGYRGRMVTLEAFSTQRDDVVKSMLCISVTWCIWGVDTFIVI
jgi:cobalt/nickel transport system permease protein